MKEEDKLKSLKKHVSAVILIALYQFYLISILHYINFTLYQSYLISILSEISLPHINLTCNQSCHDYLSLETFFYSTKLIQSN